MNDPHVVALIYGIEHGGSVDYEEAEPFVREESAFRLEVRDKKARFELKDHYPEESAARESIEEYIRVWEFDACLNNGPGSFRLRFDESEIEDRNPTPGEVRIRAGIRAGVPAVSASVTRRIRNYPSPPSGLAINPDVQTMYDRYMNYRQGREPLPGMAFFCLTVLEDTVKPHYAARKIGKRKAASRYYRVEKGILDKIGEIASTRGGSSEARKNEGVNQGLTEEERRFLDRAVRKIIRRVAEKACVPMAKLEEILLSDL